jgi:phage shock protein A
MTRSQEPNDNDRRIDRLYDEVAEVRADLKADISELKGDIATLNGKMDVLIQHITRSGN